jgi:hypothetical protein
MIICDISTPWSCNFKESQPINWNHNLHIMMDSIEEYKTRCWIINEESDDLSTLYWISIQANKSLFFIKILCDKVMYFPFTFSIYFWCFNATFSNISAISWWPVLVVEEAGVSGENHRPWASNWSTLSLAAASRVHLFL